jgi:hypothetical protein
MLLDGIQNASESHILYVLKMMFSHFSFYTIFFTDAFFLLCLFRYTLFCRYEQSELIERELEQMTEQIKSIIHSLNSNQVKDAVDLLFYIN